MKKINLLALFILFAFTPQWAQAQCNVKNTAFKSGENIKYDLYFNYGIVNAKAGTGSLSVTESNYRGQPAYRTYMQLNTIGLAGNMYTVNDTLTSYVDMNLRPLLFTKEAFEGKDYSTERQSYSYKGNTINIRAMRTFRGEQKFDENVTTHKCTYDYLSILPYVRNLDYTGMKTGDKKHIQFLSGKDIVNMSVNYLGTSTIKANDGKRYEVINISMTILDDAFKNPKDAIKASLTNDKNRIPVIIDTILKIGSVRAVLRDVSGVRN